MIFVEHNRALKAPQQTTNNKWPKKKEIKKK